MKKHKYGESTINKYIPFINQGKQIERKRILKMITKSIIDYEERELDSGILEDKHYCGVAVMVLNSLKDRIIDNEIVWKSPDVEWIKKHIEELDRYYEKVINGFRERINEKE